MSFSSYNSIDSLRLLLKDIKKVYPNEKIPFEFYGTIKLHGTNAGIGYDGEKIWAQSRSNIINTTFDNNKFALYLETNKEYYTELMKKIVETNNINLEKEYIVLFGEWCGKGIQSKVGITQFEKMFFAFDVKVISRNNKEHNYYISTKLPEIISNPEKSIYNIHNFKTYLIKIDLNNLDLAQTEITKIIDEVEANCPITESLGKKGIGEGVVFRHYYNSQDRFVFKAKGKLHQVTESKQKVPVKVEINQEITEFIKNTCTENRFEQALEHIYKLNPDLPTFNKDYELKDLKYIVEWIRDDIIKEERDTIEENNFDTTTFYSLIAKIVSKLFKNKIN